MGAVHIPADRPGGRTRKRTFGVMATGKDDGLGPGDFRVERRSGEIIVRVCPFTGAGSLPAPGQPLVEIPPMALNPGWRWLTPLGERMVRTLVAQGGEMSGRELCEATDSSPTGKGKDTLADLAERGVLASSPTGYRLAVPGGVAYQDYARCLLGWLDSQETGEPGSQGK